MEDDLVHTTTPSEDNNNDSSRVKEKRDAIHRACKGSDTDTLVKLATSPGGFLDDESRRKAWPLLLNCSKHETSDNSTTTWQDLPPHRDEEQVRLDVDRAFVYYPNNESTNTMKQYRTKLFDLIVRVLRTHPMLCYFQGYHDIAQVLLLVLGEDDAFPTVSRLSLYRIRDYMLPTLSPAVRHLRLIPPILQLADRPLARHLSQTEPFFALSATLTLYAHDIQEYSDIARLYDFILAHEPVISLYLFACIILRRRDELMNIPVEEPEMIHFTLSKLPQPLNLEALITETLELFHRYPPEKLPGGVWRQISESSVLKSTRSIDAQQDLRVAEQLFAKQKRQLDRERLIKSGIKFVLLNRRSVASAGTALFVAGFSFWLRKSGYDRVIMTYMWQLLMRR